MINDSIICPIKFIFISDALKNLFGDKNTRQGTIKMFEALQDIRLNKHLFYVSIFHIDL